LPDVFGAGCVGFGLSCVPKLGTLLGRDLIVQSQNRQPEEMNDVVGAENTLRVEVHMENFVQRPNIPHAPFSRTQLNAKSLMSMLPDAASVLALDPEELGSVLLEHLNSMTAQERFQLNRTGPT
jgi:hypothetical protein